MYKEIRFSQHALLKFEVLAQHGMSLDRDFVAKIILNATTFFDGYKGRKIAQGPLDERRVLRVVIELEGDGLATVVTFYPGRRERYEKDQV